MSSYAGRHAELYDLFYAGKPYREEAAFVAQLISELGDRPGDRLLDLACGTGNHAVELARRGFQVTGIDHSADMLAIAQRKARAEGLGLTFEQQQMQALDLPVGAFDAAICLFDSIGYVATNDGIAATLAGVSRSLRPGGLFICEFWHAAAFLTGHDPVRVRRWQQKERRITRISETTLDMAASLATVHYRVQELTEDGSYSEFAESQTNRYFGVQEMALLLSGAGLTPLRFHAGFDAATSIDLNTWHVLAVSRNEPDR